jgi:hypothetical protein
MSVRSIRFSRVAVLGVIAAMCLAANLRSIQAATLTINPALSSISVVVQVGSFVDGDGNTQNPDTGDPYGPGSLDPNGDPVPFVALGSSIGQADPGAAPFVLPGGVVPVLGDGSSTSLNGTINVTPGGFQINSAAVGLNVSGAWQPSNPTDSNGPPVPSELGIFLDLNNAIPTAYAVARLTGTTLDISTGAVSIDGFGNFSDPNATITLLTSNVIGYANGPAILGLPAALNTVISNEATTAPLSGTFTTVGPVSTLNIPSLVATSYVSAGASLPGFYIALIQTSNIVATAVVPEPSTIALAGMGLVGLAFASYRRIRK